MPPAHPKNKLSVMRSIKKQAGVAMMEFAIMLPVFLLILFGIINYSFLLFNQVTITNAAREGARWASINTTSTTPSAICSHSSSNTTDPCGIANGYAHSALIMADTITSTSTGAGTKGSTVTVTVSYNFSAFGYGGIIIDNPRTATAVMYHE